MAFWSRDLLYESCKRRRGIRTRLKLFLVDNASFGQLACSLKGRLNRTYGLRQMEAPLSAHNRRPITGESEYSAICHTVSTKRRRSSNGSPSFSFVFVPREFPIDFKLKLISKMSEQSDEIVEVDLDNLPSYVLSTTPEPLKIRGIGRMTV